MGLTWSVEPSDREDGDHRSDDVESQKAIELEMTDFCKEKCLVLLAWHGCDAAVYC